MNTQNPVSILLPQAVKANAEADPEGTFALVPKGAKYSDGFTNISRAAFKNAVDYAATLILSKYGRSDTFETLAYIGPGDFRYSIMAVASMKAGYKAFFPSPRNSLEAQLSLLRTLECNKLVVTEPQAPTVPVLLRNTKLATMILPSLSQLLNAEPVPEVSYAWSFEEARCHPAFVLHTSGSTGIPKPMIFTNDWISKVIAASALPPPAEHVGTESYFKTGNFFITLPSFHIAGLAFSLIIATYHGSVPVYPLPGPPPNAESVVEAITSATVDWIFVPPITVDEFSQRSDLLDVLASKVKYLFFTGGSVPKAAGDIAADKLPIWQVLGSSECGSLPLVHHASKFANRTDWNYVQLHQGFGFEMRHRIADQYELVICRSSSTEAFQPVFAHFPQATEYETRDLFTQHLTKPELWAYHSRIDDVIVFLNGEKTNPVTFEADVMAHPEVKAALVVGAKRLEAALLVELVGPQSLSEDDRSATVDRIWPTVENANRATPAHARVPKDKIIILDPSKPMLRAGKGTVQRSATLSIYSEEIEKVYEGNEAHRLATPSVSTSEREIKSEVRDMIAEVLPLDDLNFFDLGLDSLMALKIQRAFRAKFDDRSVSLNEIYRNPTVNGLAILLHSSEADKDAQVLPERSATFTYLLETFQAEIEAIRAVDSARRNYTGHVEVKVLLTGSTGALGSYLLDELLRCPEVGHIFCLNRAADAQTRQTKNHEQRGLKAEFPAEQVTFLTGTLDAENFALPTKEYEKLQTEVTHVLHNAWPVNFNVPLESFKQSLAGTVNLVRFLSSSRQDASLFFSSSVSSSTSFSSSNVVPEAVLADPHVAAPMGYGQSKQLAECLLDYASRKLGVKTTSVRIGQLAGAAKTGSGWNRHEWLPSLVTASASMGVIPESLGPDESVNWTPIDQVATVLVELLLTSSSEREVERTGSTLYNVVHPQPISWSSLLPRIKAKLQSLSASDKQIDVVPFNDWLSKLKNCSAALETGDSTDALAAAEALPAIKLLEFYQALATGGSQVHFAMDRTLKTSEALRSLEPLRPEWFEGWIAEWVAA